MRKPTSAEVVVIIDGVAHRIARVRAPRCDLTLVSDLLRLRLHARRLGWSVELRDVDHRLRELLEFIGFRAEGSPPPDDGDAGTSEDDQAGGASSRGGRPNSANSSG